MHSSERGGRVLPSPPSNHLSAGWPRTRDDSPAVSSLFFFLLTPSACRCVVLVPLPPPLNPKHFFFFLVQSRTLNVFISEIITSSSQQRLGHLGVNLVSMSLCPTERHLSAMINTDTQDSFTPPPSPKRKKKHKSSEQNRRLDSICNYE